MDSPQITLLGLGPGNPDLLTRQAWRVLQQSSEVYLRTSQHPVVAELPGHLSLHSFDHLYESYQEFEQVYAEIVRQILAIIKK